VGLGFGLIFGLIDELFGALVGAPVWGLAWTGVAGVVSGLGYGLYGWSGDVALGARLTVKPLLSKQQRRRLLRYFVSDLLILFIKSLLVAQLLAVLDALLRGLVGKQGFGLTRALVGALIIVLPIVLLVVLIGAIGDFLSTPRTSRTPKEIYNRSLSAALFHLVVRLGLGLLLGLVVGLIFGLFVGLGLGLLLWLPKMLLAGLLGGLMFGLSNGGWFVLLQKDCHRRLDQEDNLPSPPYDFLNWGSKEKKILRWVGGGVRFRHDLIQQRLANTSEGGS
jgi:hypothetical protein